MPSCTYRALEQHDRNDRSTGPRAVLVVRTSCAEILRNLTPCTTNPQAPMPPSPYLQTFRKRPQQEDSPTFLNPKLKPGLLPLMP